MFRETGGNFWILVDTDENILGSIGVFKVTESFAEIKRFFLDKSLRGTGCANDLWNLT